MAEARKWKSKVETAVILARSRPPKPLNKAKLTLTRHSAQEPDTDGLISGFKHVVDGLVEIKILTNDKPSNIGIPEYKWEKTPIRKGFITVVVESIED